MRAGRLVSLLMLLQSRGRLSATQLATELEVSVSTVFRDIEALSGAGVPVRAVRGARGGFELMKGYRRDLPLPSRAPSTGATRVRMWISPEERRLAALLDRPPGVRVRRAGGSPPGRADWVEATFRVHSLESAVVDVLALGAHAEVIAPDALRRSVLDGARSVVALYSSSHRTGRSGSAMHPAG